MRFQRRRGGIEFLLRELELELEVRIYSLGGRGGMGWVDSR